jgi:hypothetical protein
VEDFLIVELKTAKALASEHEAQILGYLKSAGRESGAGTEKAKKPAQQPHLCAPCVLCGLIISVSIQETKNYFGDGCWA